MTCGGCCGPPVPIPESFHHRRPAQPRAPPRNLATHRLENGHVVRRGGFFQERASRGLQIARDPRRVTFREVVALGLVILCLWRLKRILGESWVIEAGVSVICRNAWPIRCLFRYVDAVLPDLWSWAFECLGWATVAGLVLFCLEAWLDRK